MGTRAPKFSILPSGLMLIVAVAALGLVEAERDGQKMDFPSYRQAVALMERL
jgi:hypothetical protein